MSEEVHVHIRLWGRVQGVGFRVFVVHNARRFGIKGFVRNLSDGSLEIVAEGPKSAIEAFIDVVKRGPPLAIVRQVEMRFSSKLEGYKSFDILW